MKAVVLHEYGGPEELKFEDNVPEPKMSGSTVLIAAAAASVNPIDWKLRSGMVQKMYSLSLPAILGRDVSGIVRAVGANVKHFKPGDRVLALSNKTYAELVAVDDSEGAAKLAANPVGEEPASRTCPVATVVIPDGGEGDLSCRCSGVNVPAGKA
jgi:NADPH:quinone reductase-like Zn-dependent oxidoreductase